MARKMRKFSAGGAQGKYDRRMADIKKDFEKDSAGKSGKALEVLAAKRAQRTADAEDDRAKRTGGDRTATRAAERAAESNLTKTRKFGAPQAVVKDTGPVAKITESLSLPKMDVSIGAKPAAKKPAVKAPVKVAAAAPKRMGDQGFAYKKKDMPSTGKGVSTRLKNKDLETEGLKTGNKGTGTNRVAAAADPKDHSSAAARARAGAALSYLNPFSYISGSASARYAKEQKAKGYAKGGKAKTMKYAKGGSTPPQPTPADRARSKAQLDSLKKAKTTPAEGKVVGSANRSEGRGYAKGGVTKEMPSSNQMGSMNMAKGGKTKMKAKAKGNPFAATKFGAAMMKKSADTEGRAMKKFAKGGSIDGIAQRGKTKTKRVTMKSGGSC